MKKSTAVKLGIIAGAAVGIAVGGYIVYKYTDIFEKLGLKDKPILVSGRGDLHPAGMGDSGLYADKESGEPLFFASDLIKDRGDVLYFSKPMSKDSVVYDVDADDVGGDKVSFRAPSNDTIIGHVVEEKNGDATFVVRRSSLKYIPRAQDEDFAD